MAGDWSQPIQPCSTFIDPDTRRAMGEQAVALSKAVGYDSAGMFVAEHASLCTCISPPSPSFLSVC